MAICFVVAQLFHVIFTITIHSLYCEMLLSANGRECRVTFSTWASWYCYYNYIFTHKLLITFNYL